MGPVSVDAIDATPCSSLGSAGCTPPLTSTLRKPPVCDYITGYVSVSDSTAWSQNFMQLSVSGSASENRLSCYDYYVGLNPS